MKKELIVNNEEYIELNGEETVEFENTSWRMKLASALVANEEKANARKEARLAKKEAKEDSEDESNEKKIPKKLIKAIALAGGAALAAAAISLISAAKHGDEDIITVTDYETTTDEIPEEECTDSEETEEKTSEE